MRYLTLAEAMIIAEAVTGIDRSTLARTSRLELLDSAIHAPQGGFGDVEFYPEFVEKAAVLTVRIAQNHPLPDGNKRRAWEALRMFCALNGLRLEFNDDDAVEMMLGIAADDLDEADVAEWLASRLSEDDD